MRTEIKTNVGNLPKKTGQGISNVRSFLFDNMVMLLFVVICGLGIWFSKLPISFILSDLVVRIARNAFLILALLIPVMAGMGLNFAIVLGAMAGQLAILMVVHWQIGGLVGFLLAVLISTPLAMLFGVMTGRLLNKTRGQEMITSMVTGFFANGLYQLLLLVLVGTLIKINNPELLLGNGIGVKNTVDLRIVTNAIDGMYIVSLPVFGFAVAAAMGAYYLFSLFGQSHSTAAARNKSFLYLGLAAVIAAGSMMVKSSDSLINFIEVPAVTFALIAIACLFNLFIIKTKLGQDFRTVGQDQHIAKVSGIDVNKTRIIAITISTVLAAWGQLLLLQNFGNLNTYGSHESVGMFAIAALLIGGASVAKATVGQALIGMVLFHTLFIVSPNAGKTLLGDAQLGEFFRAFVAYGVIAASLAMYAWKRAMAGKKKLQA
ncbi:MAG: simple sugar transport system permease protein [Bacillota bacterium]|nr:MAG: simple sugar transport system permease protein [Bacillota bacterium]MBS3949125.1 ABC transporter permease [Peptococcaceae bacterium]